ncbi:hypothetical protein KAU08_12565 [bacterium]|nr:hypothetical protein [bacterium]
MKPTIERDWPLYNSKQLFFQWLHRRYARLFVSTRIIALFVWSCAAISFISSFPQFNFSVPGFDGFIFTLLWTLTVWLPIFLTFKESLISLPRVISDDTNTGFIGSIFSSPLPSGDIVSGLRKFFIHLNLMYVTPLILFFILTPFISPNPNVSDWDRILMSLYFIPYFPCTWWLIIESGIFAATLPKPLKISGVTLIILVFVILIGINIGSNHVAQAGWVVLGGSPNPWDMAGNDYNELLYEDYYPFYEVWWSAHKIVLLLIPTLILFFTSTRRMENLRRGRWS